jgi:hypothetical protein
MKAYVREQYSKFLLIERTSRSLNNYFLENWRT